MNTLYYSPGACSIGIHILLEEIGKPYDAVRKSTRDGSLTQPDFVALNAKSKVPTLVRGDGSVLTEYPAIAFWLARTNPEAKLLPEDAEGQARVLEAMDYAVATIHMQAFSRQFGPARFAVREEDFDAVKARGRELAEKGFATLDKALEGKDYVAGAYSIADSALFYVEFWAAERLNIPLPANCAAHYARMKARPAVQAVLAKEGFA